MPNSGHAQFAKERHVKYWLRCLRTLLPNAYTSTDSSRLSLAFFTLAALDLLDILNTALSFTDRQGYIDWIYQCQLPTGGFRGSPSHDLGDKRTTENGCWDPATNPMTFFALSSLLILGDDFSRVKRRECLEWLAQLQNPDGSFGEFLGEDGQSKGGYDPRQCRCAAAIRYILRGEDASEDLVDIDVENLVSYLASCQTYDGGYSEGPLNESHAGLSYCAIGALSFLERIPANPQMQNLTAGDWTISFKESIRWLVSRQTIDFFEDQEGDTSNSPEDGKPASQSLHPFPTPIQRREPVERDPPQLSGSQHSLNIRPEDIQISGFNGRVNKIADTCYCFWVEGSLAILGSVELSDRIGLRRYLLEKTQHTIGGFAKTPGEPPDMLHAYLGLAALSVIGEDAIGRLDPGMCTSTRARDFMKTLPWWRGDRKTVTIPFRSKQGEKSPELNHSYIAISGG